MNSPNIPDSHETIRNSREALLVANPDRLFGVYNLISDDDDNIRLELVPDALCCYPNQLANLQGLDEDPDIAILDINELRKGKVQILEEKVPDPILIETPNGTMEANFSASILLRSSRKNTVKISHPILLSGGVLEIYGAKKAEGEGERDHILTTLRDGGTVDTNQYTSVAGRNIGADLMGEAKHEQAEESPFLLVDANGNFALGVRSREYIDTLKTSIENWKQKIQSYRLSDDPKKQAELAQAEKYVKKLFPKIGNLNTMMGILDDVVALDNFVEYQAEPLDTYPGVEKDMRTIQIGDHSGRFYVYHDKANNTIEYRKLERITGIPPGYKLSGRGSSRLYLESVNQRPRTHRLVDRELSLSAIRANHEGIHWASAGQSQKNIELGAVVRAFIERTMQVQS